MLSNEPRGIHLYLCKLKCIYVNLIYIWTPIWFVDDECAVSSAESGHTHTVGNIISRNRMSVSNQVRSHLKSHNFLFTPNTTLTGLNLILLSSEVFLDVMFNNVV